MAYSTVAVTPGVGAGIAVDTIGGAQYQVVRLSSGAGGLSLNDLSQAKIDHAANGENVPIAAVALQTVRIYKMVLIADSPVSLSFKDAAGGTLLTGVMLNVLNYTLDFDGEPWYVSAVGGTVVFNLGSAVGIRGRVWYRQGA